MAYEKLKIVLLIDDFFLQAWIYGMLKKVNESDYATIVLIVKNKNKNLRGTHKRLNTLAYILYRKLENKMVKLNPNALTLKNISSLLNDVPILEVQPSPKEGFELVDEKDIQIIQSYKPDVCIKLGLKKVSGSILSCAKFGTWAYTYGNNIMEPGVWEVMHGICHTEIGVTKLTDETEQGVTLYRSFSSTQTSINKNMNIACWKAASFIPRILKKLYENRNSFLENLKKKNQTFASNNKSIFKTPGNSTFIAYLFSHYFNQLKKKIDNLFNFQQWMLLYNFRSPNELPLIISKYHKLAPPKDRFWADPCLFSLSSEKRFIFLEEYIYKKKKAHISVIELNETGKSSEPQLVLDKPYHLSYPFVFNAGDEIFMIPETSANRTIEIYKCISFPYQWEFKMNLMENLHAVDATVHYYKGKYWLFANIKENKGASAWDELFLFYSNELLTKTWNPHSQNPVISDVRSARPAGRLFVHQNKLFRPSQDSSCTYGYAINLNELITLSETEYEERKITTIFPHWEKDAEATHTFSYSDGAVVIDARVKRKK